MLCPLRVNGIVPAAYLLIMSVCCFQLDLPSYLTSPRDEIQMFLTALIPGMLLCGTVLFPTIRKSAQLSRERAALFYSKSKDDNQKGLKSHFHFCASEQRKQNCADVYINCIIDRLAACNWLLYWHTGHSCYATSPLAILYNEWKRANHVVSSSLGFFL